MAREQRPVALSPVRVFTTKGALGTGLGLWGSKQIIETHGGTLRLRSRRWYSAAHYDFDPVAGKGGNHTQGINVARPLRISNEIGASRNSDIEQIPIKPCRTLQIESELSADE